jgi:AAA family ATP:ADP antiporter
MTNDAQVNLSSNSTSINPPSKLNKLASYIWPIYRHELPKFLFITLLMFCILGIQNLIRAMKDSVVNTMIGTETIAFLKFWGVLPAAFVITIIYVKLVSVMKGEKIFYLVMSSFLAFFILFAFYLFPNYESFHLSQSKVEELILSFPNFKWFILLTANWSFSLFYIIAELWPNAVFALLFWQFVNKITTVDESKRFYPIFGLLGQTGIYLSGTFLMNLEAMDTYVQETFGITVHHSILSIQLTILVVTVLGVIALITFWIINNQILDASTAESLQFKVKKQTMTLKESFKMIMGSRYIRLITILLICYGIAINLVEGPWKATAKTLYPTTTEFAAFVGSYLSYTGIVTILFVILGSNIVRKLGWFSAAIITPFMVLSTGMMFFAVANFDSVGTFMMISLAFTDPVMLAIAIGAVQNVLSKSSKYTLFDSTKEMSYVPLDEDLKTKGKAAADVIGTKLGKSTSALLQSIIFIIIPTATYHSISMYLMFIFALVCMVWIWAVIELNKEYKKECEATQDINA